MKPINIQQKKQEIDWSIPMWVVTENGKVVLTTGRHNKDYFWGTSLPHQENLVGLYGAWRKNSFTPLQGEHTITISNED